MQLNTHSKFYFGWQITNANRYLDFNDGSDRVATLKLGTYNAQELSVEITKKMDAASTIDFSVSFNRTTRQFTISGSAGFSLLALTGANAAQSVFSLLGYTTTSDKTAASTYTSEGVSANAYSTQFYIQSYKDTSTNRKAIDGVVNKSASGVIEVIKFGDERFMEGEFLFITDIVQESGSINRTNATGLADFTTFIEFACEKGQIEFMKDENDVSTFQTLILESTESDSKGLDYDIIEMYDRGLAYYYRSGKLKFRLVG